ncbi:MAG: SH3 domain-containing protein [Caldilineaceae bacterium]
MFQAIGILLSNGSAQLRWMFGLSVVVALITVHPLFAQTTSSNVPQPTAVVVSVGLNIRSGPGLTYAIVGYLRQNQEVPILGQAENCRWLLISMTDAKQGWISGKPAYVSLNGDCKALGASANPQAQSAAQPASTNSQPATAPTVAPPPTKAISPTPPPLPTQAEAQTNQSLAQPPAGQGCYLLQNRLGPQITVTFTNRSSGQSIQILVPHGAEVAQCLVAGEYTYTISAVGFKDKNGEMKVIVGDAYMLPIEW